MSTFAVNVYPSDGESMIEYNRIAEITLIDSNSHGQAAIGKLESLPSGASRLLICSPNVVCVQIKNDTK